MFITFYAYNILPLMGNALRTNNVMLQTFWFTFCIYFSIYRNKNILFLYIRYIKLLKYYNFKYFLTSIIRSNTYDLDFIKPHSITLSDHYINIARITLYCINYVTNTYAFTTFFVCNLFYGQINIIYCNNTELILCVT